MNAMIVGRAIAGVGVFVLSISIVMPAEIFRVLECTLGVSLSSA